MDISGKIMLTAVVFFLLGLVGMLIVTELDEELWAKIAALVMGFGVVLFVIGLITKIWVG